MGVMTDLYTNCVWPLSYLLFCIFFLENFWSPNCSLEITRDQKLYVYKQFMNFGQIH